MIGIYKITSPSGKVYIGQSINIEKRLIKYRNLHCKEQTYLYNSLKKYGFDEHLFEVIIECQQEELNNLEIFYIDLYKSFNSKFGLNLREGGKGGKMSEETKQKLSILMKGKKHALGKKHSEEAKKDVEKQEKVKLEVKKQRKKCLKLKKVE